MKIRDLLKNFNGDNKILIYDHHDYSEHNCCCFEQAILNYRHHEVQRWSVENDVITIHIRSQF